MINNFGLAGMWAFLAVAGVVVVAGSLFLRKPSDRRRAAQRLRGLGDELATVPAEPAASARWNWSALPKLGALVVSRKKNRLAHLRASLLQAGFFQPAALLYFMGIRLSLVVLFAAGSGLGVVILFKISLLRALLWAVVGGAIGYLAPSLFLSALVGKRQRMLRNALPDALDILVLCLEGGASLNAAITWVTDEVQQLHPDLGIELAIVQREMQLGLSAGEAFRKMADRCGLLDMRDLAAVFLQSERFGAGVAKALRLYADTARQERQFRAEEIAQKAAVKILFPTLLCIFPAIFIVLLGPASFQMATLFSR